MHNFHHLMRDLAHEVDRGRLREQDAVVQVARFIQQALDCLRVNFWNVAGLRGSRIMRRMGGYDGSTQAMLLEPLELAETTGAFFDELLRAGCYVCPDTSTDNNLAAIFQTYLRPTSGMTMIVAAFHVDEHVWGMISCVHDQPRRWTAAEITALRKCASELSRWRARTRSA